MDEDKKKALTEVIASYNEDLTMEKLHRSNMMRCLGACIVWTVISVIKSWFPEILPIEPILITIWGALVVSLCVMAFLSIRLRYKYEVKKILNLRQVALTIRDEI
jgi:hypothetical protein